MKESPKDEEETEASQGDDPLLERLRKKHTVLRQQCLHEAQKAMEVDNLFASKRMHNLPPSLELISDEITLALNEIAMRCEEYAVPRVGQLLKDVRARMNQQLREAYASLEAGHKSAFYKLEEKTAGTRQSLETNASARKQVGTTAMQQSERELAPSNEERGQNAFSDRNQLRMQGTASKSLSARDFFSSTLSVFAEITAVLLRCEVVRIFLYDEYDNLRCGARFPFSSTVGDPLAGNDMELMLAKEIHTTVCHKYIAINGREPQRLTVSERDHGVMEEELQQLGWKSMTSCLIFPIFSNDDCGRSYGMIHAVNKQGVAFDRPGMFDENDEVFVSMTARLLGCLLTRYPIKYFQLPVGQKLRKSFVSLLTKDAETHLPPLLRDEVEGGAEVGNKANQMFTRVLFFRAPINAVYQSPSLRKKVRKLESLKIIDKTLSTVEFDISALEELWRVGHDENILMYQQCQQLNEQLNTLQILLRTVLDAIGASRVLDNMGDLAGYLQLLELYARQENVPMLTELISQVLLNARVDIPVPPELKGVPPGRLSPNEMIRIERRIAQTPSKLKFGAAAPSGVRTYSYDPQRRREQVRFFNELAEKRALDVAARDAPKSVKGYKAETVAAQTKKVNQPVSSLLHFGPTDYASKRPFQLGKR
ncbi:hypothetical protein TraAM80_02206 [Trypanosoma rangeli]|uniref:GAF domain-containing protein n=1 Tax=Trypanosoma rangeli TaxID=5698 RepID=A0A422NVB5_TRYRA|nr:uncharacterized protein TraAM80_02206 [Trypanosoma rangeli]RNF09408.1 hypothetical protein TraAM80_02206 [Trypanosoma rangeli]|eukprot:RNF09408.1 hypothetical protein TraAM80_02206 [Trypanosoma rangeli]